MDRIDLDKVEIINSLKLSEDEFIGICNYYAPKFGMYLVDQHGFVVRKTYNAVGRAKNELIHTSTDYIETRVDAIHATVNVLLVIWVLAAMLLPVLYLNGVLKDEVELFVFMIVSLVLLTLVKFLLPNGYAVAKVIRNIKVLRANKEDR